MQKHIRKLLLFLLVAVYSVEIASGIRYSSCAFLNIFMHANLAHLILCLYWLWATLTHVPFSNAHLLSVGLSAATIAAYLSPLPFEGTSGIIFAITGIRLSAYQTKENCARVALGTAICTIVQPASWCVHIIPLVIGFIYYRIYAKTRRYKRRCA